MTVTTEALAADAAIVIPARYKSQRFPGKPLTPLKGSGGAEKPLIQRTWDAAMTGRAPTTVYVATDDKRIANAAASFGANVLMTPGACRNGTERCAAVLADLPHVEIIVNIQGDSPLTPPGLAQRLIRHLEENPYIAVATPAFVAPPAVRERLIADARAGRVGGTSVMVENEGRALYFSKRLLPFGVESDPAVPLRLHLGVYAYRRAALAAYPRLEIPMMESAEGLEQLRFLHAGMRIDIVEIEAQDDFWEVNNPEDVALVEAALKARGIE